MSNAEKEFVLNRARADIESAKEKAKPIIQGVRERGDKALIEYTRRFDGFELKKGKIRVSRTEIASAFERVDKRIICAIKRQIKYAKKFQKAQLRLAAEKWETELEKGVRAGQLTVPIESVGLYVPGGNAPYPTVMQILGVAAKCAGVGRIVACTPPRKGNEMDVLLVAAELAGVDEVYRVGGAQAIAAMAYGTESIARVEKIAGPGNVYVTAAKQLVWGDAAIDMPAGPSEAIILADETAKPEFTAADILARAEHDANAAGVLVTPSRRLAERTAEQIETQLPKLQNRKIAGQALGKYCAIIITRNFEDAVEFTNQYAPEHLEIMCREPRKVLAKIKNAGSVFLGEFAPVAVGDYASGVNHVLPTGGNARRFSAVGAETFQKKIEFEELSRGGLRRLLPVVEIMADLEGFEAHKRSVQIRFERGGKNEKGN
ncbi:MAG: histidinol dehydrogenase [Candidatus Diapherotrites archaeon]|nr:histidinol dehydrogenase [Candidatus Micrarchaeota archaeon]MBU1940056.1 histidinol dehydrogenase [Candidatus Micrarchaeota archaeon]